MRPTADHPRRPRRPNLLAGRGRFFIIGGIILLIVLLISLRGAARFYTDYLWFQSLHLTGVWTGVLGAKLALAAIFILLFFGLMFANLFIADRIAPAFVPGPDEELVARYRDLVGRRSGVVRVVVSIIFALIAGAGTSSQWNDWVLFTHSRRFGVRDATFHTDVGFYVFKLPFLTFLGSWLFAAFVIILIVTTVAHYLNGGIRVRSPRPEVGAHVKAHLSVLLGVLALIKGYQYWLQRYQLTFSHRGTVDGALYTDTKIELKALYLLMAIAVFALALFIVNIWRRGWVLPVIAVGMWALVAVLAGAVVPAFVQKFRVQPAESRMERKYLTQNMDATRRAMGLDKVKLVNNYNPTTPLDVPTLQANASTVSNIRLWDPTTAQEVFQKLQAQTPFYEINSVNIDRYTLANGQTTQVMISNRDLNTPNIPQNSWEAKHLGYTHGYGTIMAPTNATDPSGAPDFVLGDIPVTSTGGAPTVKQSALYFGQRLSGYVMVNTGRSEVDFTDKANNVRTTHYTGADGVKVGGGLGGLMNRAAFALRFGDINPLISSNVRSSSKILMNRDISSRLHSVAPFISFDSDPYPVVLDNGRVVYIVDGYTTTKHYPNAQIADNTDVPSGGGLDHDFNYARNSVKAVVDSYDGTVKLYVVDASDPLVSAYRSAFPRLFTDVSKASADLRAHFRYPEELFRVQSAMYGRYHLSKPDDFYNQSSAWEVAVDPNFGTTGQTPNVGVTLNANGQQVKSLDRMDPYYLLTPLPGQQGQRFVLVRPYAPIRGGGLEPRPQLTGFMAAESDPTDYGRLIVYETGSENPPRGPRQVAGDMAQDPFVSGQNTLLCQQGSQCTFGQTFLVPIGNSLLYVRSQYVQGSNNGVPHLARVIVAAVNGGNSRVAVDSTLYGALSRLVCPNAPRDPAVPVSDCGVPRTLENGAAAVPTTPGVSSPTAPSAPTTPTAPNTDGLTAAQATTARDLIAKIQAALNDGKAAFGRGDYAAWAKDQAQVDQLSQQLQQLLNGTSTSTTTPPVAPSSTARPTTTLAS